MANKPPPPPDAEECSQPDSPVSRLTTKSHPSRNGARSSKKDSFFVHPIPALRGPFDESIAEAMNPDVRIRRTLDAAARRLQLLELDEFPEDYSSRWRTKPNAKFHPLWKLIAQISFGIHLLHQHKAKSEEEVIGILQAHIDEVDGFLEDSHADFDLAVRDIDERARLLQLSLDHGRTFGRMLRDPDFRSSILHGNDVIERIIHRTSKALKTSLDDVRKGVQATAEFAKYLDRVRGEWTLNNEDMEGVYEAMRGNAEGWYCCFNDLEDKAKQLRGLMARLGALVGEVARRAGIASRKAMREQQKRSRSQDSHGRTTSSSAQHTPDSPSKRSLRASMSKPLPPNPHHRIQSMEFPQTSASTSRRPSQPDSSVAASSEYDNSRRPSQADRPRRSSHRSSNAMLGPRSSGLQPEQWQSLQNTPSMYHGSPRVTASRQASMKLSPVITSSLTPDDLLQALETQQQNMNNHGMDARSTRVANLTPLTTPLTPTQMLHAMNGSQRSSQGPGQGRGGLQPEGMFFTSLGSPVSPRQLLQTLEINQQSPRRLPGSSDGRPMTSPAPTSMSLPMTFGDGDIHLRLEDLAGDQPLTSPPATQMLIPVMTDEGESMQLGEIFIAAPQNGSAHGSNGTETASPITPAPESEEKQVMSSETFLMLDDGSDSDDDRSRPRRRPSLLEDVVEVEEVDTDTVSIQKRGKAADSTTQKANDTEEATHSLSRSNTQRSNKSRASSGRRSRPHSSYSVIEAWRKSKGTSTASADTSDQPPVPEVPSIPALAFDMSRLVDLDNQRPSTDSAAPALAESGSVSSAQSSPHPAANALAIRLQDDTLDQGSSPPRLAIIDDGMLDLISPTSQLPPSLRSPTARDRPRSIDLIMRDDDVTNSLFPGSLQKPQLFRSNSTRSHRRHSAFSFASAYSKQASPNIVMPSSFVPTVSSKLNSPFFGSLPSKTTTPYLPQSANPFMTTAMSLSASPNSTRPDSWISEKVVVIPPPPPNENEAEIGKLKEMTEKAKARSPPIPRKPVAKSPVSVPMPWTTPTEPVEADDGQPLGQRMITTFTPLSPASPGGYRLATTVPASPSTRSNASKEALPVWPSSDGRSSRLGTLKRPVTAVRGLFKKSPQQQ